MKKVLVAEDEESIREFIVINLTRSGYTVEQAENGAVALEKFAKDESGFDVAILDIMMPEVDGLAVCKQLRAKSSDLGIIMLSAKTQEMDKITGLMFGADDYVTKPFGIMELLSRIRSVLRRTRKPQEAGKKLLSFDGIVVDQEQHSVTSGGREVQLTLKEFDLLCYLLLNKGIVLSRDQIMQAVWDSPFEMESRTIDMHIMSLRQKLGNEGACIRTVRGVGYRLGDRKS